MCERIPARVAVMFAILTMTLAAKSVFSQESHNQGSSIDPAQLKSFARTYVQFEKIRDTYLPRLKNAQSVRETNDIEKEARTRITEVLKKEGLTPESYSQIVKQLNTDGELRAKAMQMIDEEREKS
jgi:Domain of unknown function (DUF4168)